MANYILTDETLLINNSGTTLHRIMATTTFGNVMEGDIGGWVENYKNLSAEGWVYDEAKVYDYGLVSGNAKIFDDAEVNNNANVGGFAEIHDNVVLGGKAKVGGTAKLYTDIFLDAKIEINEDSWSGITYFNGSQHTIWQESKNTITIGCVKRNINVWLADFQNIGAINGYPQTSIDEYGIYIQQIADLYA